MAAERIKDGYYTVELVPEGTTQRRYIWDDGNYPVEETPSGKVFEGFFGSLNYDIGIVSEEWLRQHPNRRNRYIRRRFKLVE